MPCLTEHSILRSSTPKSVFPTMQGFEPRRDGLNVLRPAPRAKFSVVSQNGLHMILKVHFKAFGLMTGHPVDVRMLGRRSSLVSTEHAIRNARGCRDGSTFSQRRAGLSRTPAGAGNKGRMRRLCVRGTANPFASTIRIYQVLYLGVVTIVSIFLAIE